MQPSRRDVVERLLARYRNGDLSARDELVALLRPLTQRLAARYSHTSEPQEDLEQVAWVGLVKAIDRFDPALGEFTSYAVPSILGELKRHFRDHGWNVRVPRPVQESFIQVSAAIDRLSGELGRSPTPRDVAAATGLPLEDVLEALEVASAYSPARLDGPRPGGDDDGSGLLIETLSSEETGYRLAELGATLEPALRALPPREREILRLRFVEDLTQSEIAERVGISQMHVSRLLRRSLAQLAATTR